MEILKEVSAMPAFNGTGPRGLGPMTGRGLGYCAMRFPSLLLNRTGAAVASVATGAARRFFGYGRGLGYGLGRGLGRGYGFGLRRRIR